MPSPGGKQRFVLRPPTILVVALLLVGCGTPTSVEKQAEEIASRAAEGALLAHDAAEGDTTATFTRVHADALRRKVEALASQIDHPRLARVARTVAAALERIGADADDRGAAIGVEIRLERAARTAEAIGKSP